jgi:hypothetical protein
MNVKRSTYLTISLGWGLGQAMNLIIGIVIGGSILSGEIGRVIYTGVISKLIAVGIGGLIGGLICGIFLRKIMIIFLPKKSEHYYIFVIVGWAIAFMMGESVYRFAEAVRLFVDVLQSLFMSFMATISILIIGFIGSISTTAGLDISSSKKVFVVGGWCLGLLLAYGISRSVVGLIDLIIPFSWDFIVQQTLMNAIIGFLYGALAGWFGSWMMFKIIKQEN